jgi:hypothetical protein
MNPSGRANVTRRSRSSAFPQSSTAWLFVGVGSDGDGPAGGATLLAGWQPASVLDLSLKPERREISIADRRHSRRRSSSVGDRHVVGV